MVAAASVALALSGCSSGVSRFDFPSFNLTDSASASADPADQTTTSALPVPPESVYSPANASGGQISRASLPPPASSTRATPAAYTPAPAAPKPRKAAYSEPKAPRPEPAVMGGGEPSGLRVKVAKGDTLSSLSRRYGVPVEAIQSANNLSDARLIEGQRLVIPGARAQAAEAADPVGPATYKVAKGDTPNSIAKKLGVSEKALIAQNKLRPDNLQIGQVLVVPGRSQGAAPSVAAAETKPALPKPLPDVRVVKTTTIPAPGGTSLAEAEAAAADGPTASPEVTGGGAARVARNDQLPAPDPMSGNSFRWPVKGRIISGFGTKPDGGHNDGINLSVPQGTSVKAAENGVVAYAGSELKGYGNLVLVRHSNNWVSAYAHNEEVLVKRGDKVRRGQIIAKAGATGSVSQPQVHFELRKGSRPVDPTKYMSEAAASAD